MSKAILLLLMCFQKCFLCAEAKTILEMYLGFNLN